MEFWQWKDTQEYIDADAGSRPKMTSWAEHTRTGLQPNVSTISLFPHTHTHTHTKWKALVLISNAPMGPGTIPVLGLDAHAGIEYCILCVILANKNFAFAP